MTERHVISAVLMALVLNGALCQCPAVADPLNEPSTHAHHSSDVAGSTEIEDCHGNASRDDCAMDDEPEPLTGADKRLSSAIATFELPNLGVDVGTTTMLAWVRPPDRASPRSDPVARFDTLLN